MENVMKTRLFILIQLLLASLYGSNLAATETPGNILVTATRIDPGNLKARGNTTVITAADIEKSTAHTLAELLGREAGVLTRSLYGNNGTGATVDIRGFGAASGQNTLILLDGRRLNDVDLSSVDFSVIPLQSIERIEIMRNSGAVLYGDGAVGGTINIITRHPGKSGTTGFVKAGAGNLNTKQVDAHVSHNSGPLAVFLGAHGAWSDGYRDNNDLNQRSINSDIRYTVNNSELFLKLNGFDQDLELPGTRKVIPASGINEIKTDRKGTSTPRDYANQDGYLINPGYTHYWDDGTEAILDFSYRHKNQKSLFDYGGGFSDYSDTDLDTWSFTPRVITPHRLLGMDAKTTAGVDYYDSDYDSDRSQRKSTQAIHRLHIDQKSTAAYADTSIAAAPDVTVNLGARVQWVKQDGKDKFDPTAPGGMFGSGAPNYHQSDRVHMLEAGVERQFTPATAGYIKWTRSARISTVDELFEFDSMFIQVFSPLDPQTSNGVDIGTRYDIGKLSLNANAYYMRLKDEIHYNNAIFQNVNLDPTKRYGVELIGKVEVTERLRLQGNYTYMRSKFRDGVFSGNDVPLVPENTASLAGTWQQSPNTDFTVAVNFVDNSYFGNDLTNNFGKKIPSYTTVDAGASHIIAGYRLGLEANNIFDEKFFDTGFSGGSGRYSAYPLPERTILFTVSREFGSRD
jgi:iron complex outermembrane receptor protein